MNFLSIKDCDFAVIMQFSTTIVPTKDGKYIFLWAFVNNFADGFGDGLLFD